MIFDKKIVITKKNKPNLKVEKMEKNEISMTDYLVRIQYAERKNVLQKIKKILKSQEFLNELNKHVSEYAFHEFYMDCWSKKITIKDFINLNKQEHSVIVGVKFGNIFQNALKNALKEIMSNEITDSEKDLELFDVPFELIFVKSRIFNITYGFT